MKFDVISDIHVELWVPWNGKPSQTQKLQEFVKKLLPEKPSSTLIIAGDIGSYNKQNFLLLNILKQYYTAILLVEGNHDLYLISKNIQTHYHRNSFRRTREMRQMVKEIPKVQYLDEASWTTTEGIPIGGCSMWYDFSWGVQEQRKNLSEIQNFWKEKFHDAQAIFGEPANPLQFFETQRRRLDTILDSSRIIVTHVSPDGHSFPDEEKNDPYMSFYCFDGTPWMNRIQGKIWIFGHLHIRMDYKKYGCRFINASLGYPRGNEPPQKILTFEI